MIWRKLFLGLIGGLVVAAAAQAGSLTIHTSQRIPPFGSPTAGVQGVANVIQVNFTDTATPPSLSGQQLLLNLTVGSILNTGGGTDGGTRPPYLDDIAGKPSLAYDSFLTMGGLTAESSTDFLIPPVDPIEYPSTITFPTNSTSKMIDAVWAPATGHFVPPANNFITAQITLSANAQGTWSYYGTTADGTAKTYLNLPITGGVMLVPEPASTTLLTLAFVGLLRTIWRAKGDQLKS